MAENTSTIEKKEPSAEALLFIKEHKARLEHIADELEWLQQNLIPLMEREGLDIRDGWSLRLGTECWERDTLFEGDAITEIHRK